MPAVAPAIPLIGASGALPAIPNPDSGVPSTPDFLTGLVDAVPQAVQGFQAAQQAKMARMKMAGDLLQTYAPMALQNPTDPNSVKQMQKIAKQMGLNPNAFLTQGQSGLEVNPKALMEYSPWMKVFSSPAMLYAGPNAMKAVGNQISPGLGDQMTSGGQFAGITNPKDLPGIQKQGLTALGQGQWETAIALGQALVASGNPLYVGVGNSYIQAGTNRYIPPQIQAKIDYQKAGTNVRNAEAKEIDARTSIVYGPNGLDASIIALNGQKYQFHVTDDPTKAAIDVARYSQIVQQTAESAARTNKIYEDVTALHKRLGMEMQRLSIDSMGKAITSADAWNSDYSKLEGERDSLIKTISQYSVTGNRTVTDDKGNTIPNPDLEQAKKQLAGVNNALKAMGGRIDTTKITNAALHKAGLPSTMHFKDFLEKEKPPAGVPSNATQVENAPSVSKAQGATVDGKHGMLYPGGWFVPDK